jgi:hypothetical protein
MVLVELRIKGRNLALAKRVIERPDRSSAERSPAEEAVWRSITSEGGQAGRLLIGCYIAQLWQLFQLLDKALRPSVQFVRIRIFEVY